MIFADLHTSSHSPEDLQRVAGEKVAVWIIKACRGEFNVEAGRRGLFGRVVDILSPLTE